MRKPIFQLYKAALAISLSLSLSLSHSLSLSLSLSLSEMAAQFKIKGHITFTHIQPGQNVTRCKKT